MNIMRSLMFVPGNRRDMLEKSLSFRADIIVPDMQDSVPLSEKQSARDVIPVSYTHLTLPTNREV